MKPTSARDALWSRLSVRDDHINCGSRQRPMRDDDEDDEPPQRVGLDPMDIALGRRPRSGGRRKFR